MKKIKLQLKKPQLTRRSAIIGGAGVVAIGAATAFGVSRCARGDENVPAEPTAGDASTSGKRGGKLTLYTSCDEDLINAVVPAFAQETGIVVDVVQKTAAECRDAVAAEVQAGSPVADVVWGGDASWYAARDACFEKYFSAENSSVRDDCRNSDGCATPVTREACVIAVNKALADELGVEIAGYADLLGEKCAGLVALADPERDAAGLSQLEAVLAAGDAEAKKSTATAAIDGTVTAADTDDAGAETAGADAAETAGGDGEEPSPEQEADAGEELLEGILAQAGGNVMATSEDVLEAVLGGQALAGLVYEQPAVGTAKLTDEVEVVYPSEGSLVTTGCSAIVRGCDNHEQARSWIDFVTGETCQKAAAAKAPMRSVRDGVGVQDGMPSDDDLEVLEASREDALEVWASLRS